MRFSSTARAVVSLSETVYNHPWDALLLYHSCSHQSTGYGYNHPRDAFLMFRLCSHWLTGYGLQLSKGCVSPAPLVHSSVYQIQSTIIYGMRYSCTACTIPSLLDTINNYPGDDAILLHRSCTCQSIRDGLQSSKTCASTAPLVQSSVFWLRLESSEGCLLEVPFVQSLAYWVWSMIIQGMRFS